MSSQFSAVTFNDVTFQVSLSETLLPYPSFAQIGEMTQADVDLRKNQIHHLKYSEMLYDEIDEMVDNFQEEMSEIRETLKGEPQNREFLNHRLYLLVCKTLFCRSVLALNLQTAQMFKDKHFEVSTEYLMFLSENNQFENDYLNECDTEAQYHEDFLEFLEKVELMTDPDLAEEFKYMPIVFRIRESERASAH